MPRTRVHNMNISLDGYAAGEHVTFDAPIGGAERLFKWFDGQHVEPGHRRRDHGTPQVRSPGWRLARRRLAGLVGRRAAIPDTSARHEPLPAPND